MKQRKIISPHYEILQTTLDPKRWREIEIGKS